jgi:hypothetical protein
VRPLTETKRRVRRSAPAATLALFCAVTLHASSAQAATSTFSVTTNADAHVSAASPGANYGSSPTLEIAGSPTKRAYLRFNVSVPAGAVITRTTLRLYFTSQSSSGYDVDKATSNAWSEGTINFANAPGVGGIDARGTSIAAGWNSLVVPPADPDFTTYVLSRGSSDIVSAHSRENANRPQLVVEYTIAPTEVTTVPSTPPKVSVLADARVQESTPTTNYGTSQLRTDGGSDPDVESYLRFSVGAFLGRIQSAKLRVHASSGTLNGPAVYTTSNAWSERGITWSNRPGRTSVARDDKGAIGANSWVEYDVTPFVRGNGTYSFVLATSSRDNVDFFSRESSLKPRLVVSTTSGRLESRSWVTTMSWETMVADLNLDGLEDYLVTRHEWDKDSVSLQGSEDTFAQGSSNFPPADRHGCAAGDVSGDGRPDVYCMLGAGRGEEEKQNELWLARPDGTYVDEAALWGVTDPLGRGRRPVLFHFNNDGLLDLYITNWGPRADGRRSENILYLNVGGRFVEHMVTATGPHGSACAEVGDWNNDGRLDLLVCGPQLNLFRNAGGLQTELKNELLGAEPVAWARDAKLRDLNGDGRNDLITVTAKELQVRLNLGGGARFSRIHRRVPLLDGMSVAVGDLTGDEHPDLYVVQGYANDRNWNDLLLAGPGWLGLEIPQTDIGRGCTADSIDVGGRETVLVTNGLDLIRGPVQFISFREG